MSSTSAVSSALTSSTTASSAIDVSSVLAAIAGTSTPGIDVSSAVAAALYADRAQERVWQSEQTTLTSQASALTSIQTATQALYTDFDNLNSLTGPLASRAATSSNTSAVTASAATGTVTGTHTLTVSSLAATASWYSDLASSATATLPNSSFTLTTSSGSTTFSMGSSGASDLTNLASNINSANLGVTASVLTDSSGSRLAIVANASGAASDFSITSAPYTGTTWSSPTLSSGQTLGADSFTLSSGGGTATTITTTDGETLQQLADSINGQSLGVTASVVTTSSGSNLQINSSDGTTPFTISEPSFGFSQAAQGTDASFTVDGVPLTSATNTVTTAISGVTLNLDGLASAAAPVTLSIAPDSDTVTSAISQFVTDYNTAIGLVNSQYTYSTSTSSQGALASDPTIRQLQTALLSVQNYVHTASSTSTGTNISGLAALGITTNTDGTLSLDTSTLSNQIVNNAGGVQDFLMGSALNGFASQVTSALSTFTQSGSGAFTVDLNSINSTNTELTTEINNYESIYIANQQTILTTMYSNAEAALQSLPTQLKEIQAELGNTSSS